MTVEKICKMGVKAPPKLWIRTASLADKYPQVQVNHSRVYKYQSEPLLEKKKLG